MGMPCVDDVTPAPVAPPPPNWKLLGIIDGYPPPIGFIICVACMLFGMPYPTAGPPMFTWALGKPIPGCPNPDSEALNGSIGNGFDPPLTML
jgi:hypothetical protein